VPDQSAYLSSVGRSTVIKDPVLGQVNVSALPVLVTIQDPVPRKRWAKGCSALYKEKGAEQPGGQGDAPSAVVHPPGMAASAAAAWPAV
jgi:hypothetical protein